MSQSELSESEPEPTETISFSPYVEYLSSVPNVYRVLPRSGPMENMIPSIICPEPIEPIEIWEAFQLYRHQSSETQSLWGQVETKRVPKLMPTDRAKQIYHALVPFFRDFYEYDLNLMTNNRPIRRRVLVQEFIFGDGKIAAIIRNPPHLVKNNNVRDFIFNSKWFSETGKSVRGPAYYQATLQQRRESCRRQMIEDNPNANVPDIIDDPKPECVLFALVLLGFENEEQSKEYLDDLKKRCEQAKTDPEQPLKFHEILTVHWTHDEYEQQKRDKSEE